MTRLLRPQQIARSPDLQVPHGNFEAGAEFGEVPDGRQSLFRHLGEGLVRLVGEVGKGMAAGPAHPAPELMELTQTQAVGMFNDQGIGIGNVQAGLNDGGTYQHLNLPVCHRLHHISQGLLSHLAMGHGDGQLRHPPFHSGCALIDGLHPVMQVIHLAAPLDFPTDGVVQNSLVVLQHKGLDRISVGRRRFDGGHIPNAGQGHVQRPGNGGGGQGEDIHPLGDFLQPLFMRHAKTLLLVHHQKAQILELDALLQELMGSNDHIQGAGPEVLEGLLLLGRRAEPAEHIYIHRKAPEAAHHCLVMLLGQNCGGHQNGHLLAVQHGLHHCPQGHLRLAKAHIAAQQPVHGHRRLHIPLDLPNAPELVVGLGVGKVVFKLLLPGGIGGKRITTLALPGGIELDQLPGHILGRLPGPGLGLLPGVGADFVQLHRGVLAAANVFADEVQLGGRDIQGVGALVGDLHIVLHYPVHPDLLHGFKPANAVLLMDHQIPRGQVRKGSQLLAVGGAGLGCLGLGRLPGHELALGEHREAHGGIFHAAGQVSLCQQDLPRLGQGPEGERQEAGQPPIRKHGLEQLRPAAGAAKNQGGKLQLLIMGQIRSGRLQIAAVARQLLGRKGQQMAGLPVLGVGRPGKGVQIGHRTAFQPGAELLPLAHKVAQLPGHGAGLQEAVQLKPQLLHLPLGCSVEARLVADHHQRILGDIVQGRGHLPRNEGHVPVGSWQAEAASQLLQILLQGPDQALILVFPPLLPGEQRLQVPLQPRYAAGVQPRLGLRHRQHCNRLHILRPPLGAGVKIPHGIQLISEKLRPDRLPLRRRIQVQDSAPEGKLTGAFHHGGTAVAHGNQASQQLFHLDLGSQTQ